jgi:UDP-N-acetylmuramoyl-tripeptide--D-alanyl-D-alanine ligase
MDQATKFGIFEIGMNHAGEIEPLTRQVKPHVALITTVEAVHIENFPNVEAIADEKSAIFLGLEEGGTAIINRDNPHYERMWTHASRSKAGRLLSFGENPFADIRLASLKMDADGSDITAEINGLPLVYRLGSPGKHLALNSLGILAVCLALGADLQAASQALSDVKPPQGRGAKLSWGDGDRRITLIDESYNANPTSMRAAFALLSSTEVGPKGRRIALVGDMLELGKDAEMLHADLAFSIEDLGIDLVYASGPLMRHLFDALPRAKQGAWFKNSEELAQSLDHIIRGGDALMVKGSNGSRMRLVVDEIKTRLDKEQN